MKDNIREITLYNRGQLMATCFFGEDYVDTVIDNSKIGFELLTEREITKYLPNLLKKVNPSSIYFEEKNLIFYSENIKVILSNRIDFEKDERFKYIFDILKQNRYKLQKENRSDYIGKIISAIVIASIVATSGLIAYQAYKNSNAEEITTAINTNVDEKDNNKIDEETIVEQEAIKETTTRYIDQDKKEKDKKLDKNNYDFIDALGLKYNSSKANYTRNTYFDTIEKYCNMYGLDSNLMCAIATHERGIHSSRVDQGGAIGLFQIQVNTWNGEKIVAHNFETEKDDLVVINTNEIANIDQNIKVGCMIFQNYLNQMKGNVIAATQCYNMGPGTMYKILQKYSEVSGLTIDEILESNDYGWLDYVTSDYPGDPDYVTHVFWYFNENVNNLINNKGRCV